MSFDDAEALPPSHLHRPVSPAPTSDFSIIDVDVETFPSIHYQQTLTYGRHSPFEHTTDYDTSFHANEHGNSRVAAYAPPFNTRRGFHSSPSLSGGSSFTGVIDDTFQGSYPFDAVNSVEGQDDNAGKGSPPNSLRTLLPRIWEALSSPGKSLFPGVSSPSSGLSPSFVSRSPSPPSSRQPFAGGATFPRRKGKGRAKSVIPDWESDTESPFIDYSELAPLDGEEGELIEDEACFIDVRAVTGVDILSLLPTELALHILILLCMPVSPPARPAPNSTDLETFPYPVPDPDALRSILACLAVSRKWRALASDNSVWRALFTSRWAIDLRRAGSVHKLTRQRCNKLARIDCKQLQRIPSGGRRQPSAMGKGSTPPQISAGSDLSPLQPLPLSWPPPQRIMPHLVSPRNAPLQLEWRWLYRERLELEKRWRCPDWQTHTAITFADEPKMYQNFSNTNLRSKWEPKTLRIPGHSDSVYCLEFDSQRIITGSRDRTIKVWSLRTGNLLGTFWRAHKGSILCLKFEHDWDQDWNTANGVEQDSAFQDQPALADMSTRRSLSERSPLERFPTTTRTRTRRGFMISGSSDCSICVWDIWTGRPLIKDGVIESTDREVHAEVRDILKGHIGGVLDLKIDKKWIVSCSKDTIIRVWDRETLELHRTLLGHDGPVNAVGLQNGRVVSASGDGKMILWDIASGERLRTFEGHDRGLACIEFKDDLIVSGSNDCKIKIWSASTGECLRTLVGHGALVRALSFDPRNGRLVSASYDKTVKLWDLRTGKMISSFTGRHTSQIFDVKLDVSRIVSTSHDHHIVVLDFSHGIDASLFV